MSKYNIHPMEQQFQEYKRNDPNNPINIIISTPLKYDEAVAPYKGKTSFDEVSDVNIFCPYIPITSISTHLDKNKLYEKWEKVINSTDSSTPCVILESVETYLNEEEHF